MNYEQGGIYHIYNQGNNRETVFFNIENYLFFLKKIKSHIQPHGSILAWCLMPNHFHLMVEIERVEITIQIDDNNPIANQTYQKRTLNDSIGILLHSYTRAVNNQEKRTGSIFRKKTKSICLNKINGIASNWFTLYGATFMNMLVHEDQYPKACFDYIHNNPVKAHLERKPEDWEFSSYPDWIGARPGKLINKARAMELGFGQFRASL